ncbi:glycosyltransferase [Clostridium estertheticum]|uniref:glycosyltransferase n=1 Tax=Clostridium estertheticum TaxID=238834 RepID=UPI001C0D1EE4|nr:glycosyltransferase [Clostridium estertheticum]WAG68130.1 glycosyltransferase [Clostridium estertheticum]
MEDFGIAESVISLGLRSDVNELMIMFDVFALPSLFKGLGIVAVESQGNGLCVVCLIQF